MSKAGDILEKIEKKIVIKNSKKVVKYISTRPGYKIVTDPKTGRKKEVKMSNDERRNRKKGFLKSRRKRSVAQQKINPQLKRFKSLEKRKSII